MNPQSFLKELKKLFAQIRPGMKVGNYTFLGINKKDGYGSPGGRWDPKKFPSFELQKDDKTFLLRILPDENKIVIEAVHLSNMLINYTLNPENFIESQGKVKLLENYSMTVHHRRSFREVKDALIASGMAKNIILEQPAADLNIGDIVNSLFTWANFRELAKAKIRGSNEGSIENKQNINKKVPNIMHNATSNLNQILFGPPGTGKTYNTINKALEIIGENLEGRTRQEIKALFDARIKEGQILFTTFHQSMSYEDFIEGIKPLKPLMDDKFVKYDIQPGLFFTICDTARSNYENSKSENKGKLSFENAFEKFKEAWEQNPQMKFPLKTVGYDFTIIGFTNSSIQFRKASGGTSHTLSIGTLKELYYGKEFNFKQGVGIYYPAVLKQVHSYKSDKPDDVLLKNYVIIIDEINRGNISQIFGELITLIENDKRLGKEEALEATLPYSKEKFGIPPNLYIIGTMNTADRSVESLDTALRRRFSFQEISPNPELVDEELLLTYTNKFVEFYDLDDDEEPWASYEKNFISLLNNNKSVYVEMTYNPLRKIIERVNTLDNFIRVKELFAKMKLSFLPTDILKSINLRIEKLLDKDHKIGHSYFMKLNNLSELKAVFQNKIIPLLQEYFFGDYGKIGLILGPGFFEPIKALEENIFANFDNDIASEFSERIIYKFKDISAIPDEEFIEAINALLKK